MALPSLMLTVARSVPGFLQRPPSPLIPALLEVANHDVVDLDWVAVKEFDLNYYNPKTTLRPGV